MTGLAMVRALLLMLRMQREQQAAKDVLPRTAPRRKALHHDRDSFVLVTPQRLRRFPDPQDLPSWTTDAVSIEEAATILELTSAEDYRKLHAQGGNW